MAYTVKVVYEGNSAQFYVYANNISCDESKTLTVEPDSPLRAQALSGYVYLDGVAVSNWGQQYSGTITSNITITCASDYNIYIVTEGSSGGGHKALIYGTAYGITGGRAMVGGAVYDIEKGKTMVSGTVWEIAFAGGTAIVTITGSGYTQLL